MFHNQAPRTRDARVAAPEEKKMHEAERFLRGHKTDPLQTPGSAYYIKEEERFDRDFAMHEKMQREQEYLKKLQVYEAKRQAQYERDNARWDAMDSQITSEQDRIDKRAEIALQNKRNKNSNPYNPLTMQYDDSKEGQALKARDMAHQERVGMRSENIYSKGNSAWNPLTGQPLTYHPKTGGVRRPSPPPRPF